MEISDKTKLYNLIVNNNDFEKLEGKISRFNPFNILKIADYEIRHSNFLAWLLDPNESHELGDYFLKKFISQVILNNEASIDDNIDLADLHFANFSDTIINREEKHIDILLRSRSNKFLLLVENKIHSTESEEQLENYLKYAQNEYGGAYKIVPILLTKEGEEPSGSEEYGTFTHHDVYSLIKDTYTSKSEFFSLEISNFIRFYLQTLEQVLEMDDKTQELCIKIYNQHKEAINMIMTAVDNRGTPFNMACKEFEETNERQIHTILKRNTQFWFIDKNLIEKKIPKWNLDWESPYPLSMRFSPVDNSLFLFIIIGPFYSATNRLDFIKTLKKSGFKVDKRSERLEARYSRIYSKKVKIKDWTNTEELIGQVNNLYNRSADKRETLSKIVEGFKFETPDDEIEKLN